MAVTGFTVVLFFLLLLEDNARVSGFTTLVVPSLDLRRFIAITTTTITTAPRRFLVTPCPAASKVPKKDQEEQEEEEEEEEEQQQQQQQKRRGYRFGDISRFVAKRATDRINEITGHDTYTFGNLSRWLDQRAKDKVSSMTGKEGYRFGDLTLWADSVAKEKVANFTGKDEPYQFGDVTVAVVQKIRSGEYALEDVYLALRVLLSAGISLSPIASVLPLKWLVELINLGLTQEVGSRFLGALSESLDARMKEALTGDPNYKLGNKTKEKLKESLATFTGRETYSFGDITRTIIQRSSEENSRSNSKKEEAKRLKIILEDQDLDDELAEWDRKFQEQEGSGSVPPSTKI
jgi:hypothetical protein